MNLSQKDCDAMKGFSILCIILHNILHCVYTQENEFTFNIANFLELKSFRISLPYALQIKIVTKDNPF